jgi:hypothetical protein
MKTWLEINFADRIEKREVKEREATGEVTGACPGCKTAPFLILCHEPIRVDDRTIKAGAKCIGCGDNVGWVFHRPRTLFGLEVYA